MAQYSLNNGSIHPTYFLPTRQKAKTSLINVPGRFHQELGWWKPKKAKDAQQYIILYTTIHHSMICYYFRYTTDFIGQNTRGRSPHAILDINTTSNYCPVSLARVAQLVERRTPDSEDPGSNPINTQLFLYIFFSSFVESMFNTTQKSHLKKREKNSFNLSANSERYSDQELGLWTFQGHNKVWRQTSLKGFPTGSILGNNTLTHTQTYNPCILRQ